MTTTWWPTSSYTYKSCAHHGEPVRVGPYEVLAGGTQYLETADLEKADILIPLVTTIPYQFAGKCFTVMAIPMVDFGGVPNGPFGWKKLLRERVIPLLASGKQVLAFCAGSHGRTGCFLASLIALLESRKETPDPIAAVRKRHCTSAVETLAQAKAVFAMRGQELPAKYLLEFAPRKKTAPVIVYKGEVLGTNINQAEILPESEDERWRG